jgi:hypothetical protein
MGHLGYHFIFGVELLVGGLLLEDTAATLETFARGSATETVRLSHAAAVSGAFLLLPFFV